MGGVLCGLSGSGGGVIVLPVAALRIWSVVQLVAVGLPDVLAGL